MPVPRAAQQTADNDNMLIIVGRLLEATKAASDGIKTLNEESKRNSASLQVAQTAIVTVEKAIAVLQANVLDLDRLIRSGNGDSLVTRVKGLGTEQERILDDLDTLKATDTSLAARVAIIEQDRAVMSGGNKAAVWGGVVVAWFVTTAIAVYAAVGQWYGGSK